ncbi:hypothetical protein ACE5IS_19855, partial [Leptospira wolffii]|uniref:hypothetical protein n=1 Tax=Leptospira wolffii TaxID=409998 RepID=UPI0035CD33BA
SYYLLILIFIIFLNQCADPEDGFSIDPEGMIQKEQIRKIKKETSKAEILSLLEKTTGVD